MPSPFVLPLILVHLHVFEAIYVSIPGLGPSAQLSFHSRIAHFRGAIAAKVLVEPENLGISPADAR